MDEIRAFEAWRAKYNVQNPPPSIRRAEGLGWQFVISFLWALAAVIMVASQTSSEFYHAKILSGMDETLAKGASYMVVFAIEGGIVIAASIKAAQTMEYNPTLLRIGIWLSVAISMVAGLNSSIGILEGSERMVYNLRLFLVFAIGIGSSLIAWVSGEVLGAQVARVLSDRQRAIQELKKAEEAYQERLLDAWKRSDEYAVVRKDAKIEAEEARSAVRSVRSVRSVAEHRPNIDRTANLPNIGANEQRTAIKEYIAQIYNADGRIPGPTEIANNVGSSKSYAKQVRDEWVEENSEVL